MDTAPEATPAAIDRRALFALLAALGLTPALAACGADSADPSPGPGQITGLVPVSAQVARAEADPAAIAAAVGAIHELGAAVWDGIDTSGNTALSPFSVAVALAMTANGAQGRTLEQMLDVLGAAQVASLNAGFNALTQAVESLAGQQLSDAELASTKDPDHSVIALDSANQLFGQLDQHFETAFLDVLAASYGAGMQTVDFVDASETARTAINTWTADQTHDRIPEIIPAGGVDASTRLVLVNALYFKAAWAEEFPDPAPAPFTLGSGDSVDVPTMTSTVTGSYAESANWQAVSVPYVGSRLAMTLVKAPADPIADLPEILAALEPGAVALTVPTWTFTSENSLKRPLAEAGMPVAFTAAADFSAMTGHRDLMISDVFHQVFIAVDRHGTEAAAATAVVMRETSIPAQVAVVVLDEPFWFVIHDVDHGTPLFIGYVADPR